MADEPKNQNAAGEDNSGAEREAELNTANTDELEAKLAEAEKQRDEYLAGWQRTKADFVNYKKEEAKRLEDVARYGNEDFMKDLISVLDNFDLGLRTLEKAGPVERGIYLIRSQIEDILKKRGLEKVSVKAGDEFDPMIAEAMAEVPSERPPGVIVEEVEPGYRMGDKILRPARVILSKGQQ
jgi:molecular chaperone GrpE